MALTGTLELKVLGTAIESNSRFTDDRAALIDVVAWDWGVYVNREGETNKIIGKPAIRPARFKCLTGKHSPEVLDALCYSKAIEFTFKLYCNDPDGGGTDKVRTVFTGMAGFVVEYAPHLPDTTDPENMNSDPYEWIALTMSEFKYDDDIEGKAAQYNTRSGAAGA